MRTRTAALAATTTAVLLLTGCTSTEPKPADDKPAAQQPADDGAAKLETAVRAYSAAYFKPDADKAHGMLSKRCAAEIDPVMYGAVVEQTAKDYGKQDIKTLTVDQISGNLARVTYTYGVPKLDQQQQPWAREGGAWKYDAC